LMYLPGPSTILEMEKRGAFHRMNEIDNKILFKGQSQRSDHYDASLCSFILTFGEDMCCYLSRNEEAAEWAKTFSMRVTCCFKRRGIRGARVIVFDAAADLRKGEKMKKSRMFRSTLVLSLLIFHGLCLAQECRNR